MKSDGADISKQLVAAEDTAPVWRIFVTCSSYYESTDRISMSPVDWGPGPGASFHYECGAAVRGGNPLMYSTGMARIVYNLQSIQTPPNQTLQTTNPCRDPAEIVLQAP